MCSKPRIIGTSSSSTAGSASTSTTSPPKRAAPKSRPHPACGITISAPSTSRFPITSLYWAYGTSSEPVGSELDGTSANYGGFNPTSPLSQIFGPIESRAQEVGNKWELFDGHLLATAALFRTDVSNARELIGSSTRGTITAGAAYHVQGIDLGAEGNITDKWSVYTGLVLMKTRVDHSAVPTQCRSAARLHRQSIVQHADQIQAHRRPRSRRPGDLSLEDLRRHVARGESGHRACRAIGASTLSWKARSTRTGNGSCSPTTSSTSSITTRFYQSAAPFVLVAPGPRRRRGTVGKVLNRNSANPRC